MTVSSDTLLAEVVALLTADLAGVTVYSPRSWNTPPAGMPEVMAQSPAEKKVSLGRSGASSFNCVMTLRLVGRVYAKVQANDAAAAAALAAVGVLQRAIEVSLINRTELRAAGVQEFQEVRVVTAVKTEGEYVFGELVFDLDLEFYQGPEDFAPIDGSVIDELAIYADLLNLFSPLGDFTADPHATPFADEAAPPPRTSGPDGRAEGAVVKTNLQD